MAAVRVYLEVERTWTFACAVDHPGWQRRGNGEGAALEELEAYRDRYAAAVGTPVPGEWHVVGTLSGTTTTGFGAPDVAGPRGGGRDRDGVVDHVREAERAYGRKVGVRQPPRTPWPEQREALAGALREPGETVWPAKYAVRRIAWHVLDHAWELEDRTLR